MQPAAIQLPAILPSRLPARPRAVVPVAAPAALARCLSERTFFVLPEAPRVGPERAVPAAPLMARAIGAYRAAAAGGARPGPGSLGIDLIL